MNKKVWVGAIAVFVVVFVVEYIVNNFLMMSVYQQTASLWRPPEEMKFGVMIICWLFFSFFFTFIFSKGYEGKGIMEGVRYGFYVAMMMVVPVAYMTYATMPVPYALSLQWFIYGTVEDILAGVVLALVFGKKPAPAPAA